MNAQTIYIRRERRDETVITEHRVWDRDRFFAAQVEQYSGPKVKPDDRYTLSLATQAEYQGAKQ